MPDAEYYDTGDLRLVRAGVTLRPQPGISPGSPAADVVLAHRLSTCTIKPASRPHDTVNVPLRVR